MNTIAARRLRAQRLTGPRFSSPAEAVESLVAVQSQDFTGAKWAVGQRTEDATDALLDRLFDDGALLRTHVMRPTWHLVLPHTVRWLLELTGPRVKAALAPYDRRLEIDEALLALTRAALRSELRGGASATRVELAAALERRGIRATGQRLANLLMHAELDGIVVSGPRRGKQFTYALLDERAPAARRLDRDESLAELTRRYFSGHGPAQAKDFAWWSGLSTADARRGLAMAARSLSRQVVEGKEYWSSSDDAHAPAAARHPLVHLLPKFDEYVIAYRDRSAALDAGLSHPQAPFPQGRAIAHLLLIDGQVLGGWARRPQRGGLLVEVAAMRDLTGPQRGALERAASDLGRFIASPVRLRLGAGLTPAASILSGA